METKQEPWPLLALKEQENDINYGQIPGQQTTYQCAGGGEMKERLDREVHERAFGPRNARKGAKNAKEIRAFRVISVLVNRRLHAKPSTNRAANSRITCGQRSSIREKFADGLPIQTPLDEDTFALFRVFRVPDSFVSFVFHWFILRFAHDSTCFD